MHNDLIWVKEAINDCYEQTFKCLPEPYHIDSDCLKIQLFGAELVLLSNGKWFISDTSGG